MKHIYSVVMVLAMVGCGGKKEDGGGASGGGGGGGATKALKLIGGCDRREKELMCTEAHSDNSAVDDKSLKENCDGYGGKVVPSCPKENATVRCVQDNGGFGEQHILFYKEAKQEMVDVLCKDLPKKPV